MQGLFCVLVILRVMHLHLVSLEKEEWYTEIITLKQGDIRGRVIKPKRNSFLGEVEVFLGIPYAAPPVANLRFMPPGAPLQWSDTLDAFTMKPVCPQMLPNLDSVTQKKMSPERNNFIKRMKLYLKNESEDCLYLNIYKPRPQSKEEMDNQNYPVMLFIHGESFEWNSGNLYDGSVIAGFGKVIFITINFRLGIFGFLKQGITATAGRANFGLSDQIAALQWIKGNIAEFGGDPSNVTLMGFGTGAACVNFLMLSPVAEGLFHRAILMGGSALSEWVLTAVPLHYIQLAEELKCSSENMINCLQKKRKDDIISAFKSFEVLPFENTFTPVVDEVVVLNSPAEQMEKYSLFSKYDLLAGVSEIESYYLMEDSFLKFGMLMDEANKLIETYTKLLYKKTPDIALIKTVEKYLGHLRDSSPLTTRNAVLDALSDMLVAAPLLQTVRYHAATPKSTYLYVFGHHTTSENHIKVKKSISGDDLPYVFGVPIDGPSHHYQSDYNDPEQRLSETMIRYFTNFAKTGNPNMPTNYDFITFSSHFEYKQYAVKWPRFTLDRQPYMYLGLSPQIRHHYREEHDKFWNHALQTAIKSLNDGLKNLDVAENDDINYPPIYDLPFSSPSEGRQNIYKTAVTVAGGIAAEENVNSASFTVTVLIVIGIVFLLINIIAFTIIFYQRGKLRVRDNLFRNRFRCKAISVPDIFEENATGDIYAIAESRRKEEAEAKKSKLKTSRSKKNKASNPDDDYDAIRVASVNPEAISGKRLKRWPLARQCSGSTITIDPHSKVRDWITNEIVNKCSPRFLRKKKKRTPVEPSPLSDKGQNTSKEDNDKRKISVGIDATPAARTGSVLKQIPIEVTKSLDDGKNPLTSQIRPSTSMMCIPKKSSLQRSYAFTSEDSDEYYQKTGTHKSSAHIRLRTPEFLLDALPISHAHSRSDPAPVHDSREQLYTQVNKGTKRLKSFAESSKNTSINDSVESTSHYEDINVISLHDDLNSSMYSTQDQLCNIKRRNFPKVLPDFPDADRKSSKRLSLPSTHFDSTNGTLDYSKNRSRIPPAPPPRLSSTLVRKSGSDSEKQFSHITVQLKKPEPTIAEEKFADLIQTESCRVPTSDTFCPTAQASRTEKPLSQIPRLKHDSPKPAKNVRSVTTSTSGIPKLVPFSVTSKPLKDDAKCSSSFENEPDEKL